MVPLTHFCQKTGFFVLYSLKLPNAIQRISQLEPIYKSMNHLLQDTYFPEKVTVDATEKKSTLDKVATWEFRSKNWPTSPCKQWVRLARRAQTSVMQGLLFRLEVGSVLLQLPSIPTYLFTTIDSNSVFQSGLKTRSVGYRPDVAAKCFNLNMFRLLLCVIL